LSFLILLPFWIFFILLKKKFILEDKLVNSNEISRKNFFQKTILTGLTLVEYSPLIGTIGMLTGTFLGSREIIIKELSISISSLPEKFKGFKLAHITDLHIGVHVNENYLKTCIELLKSLKADALVITGDLIDFSNYYLPIAGKFLKSLDKSFPKGIYYSFGNHEYFDSAEKIEKEFQSLNLFILRNQITKIKIDKESINIIGLDWVWPHMGYSVTRANKAEIKYKEILNHKNSMKNDNSIQIVLNHDPTDFIWLNQYKPDLVLSGHTHGGQVKLVENINSPINILSNHFPYYTGYYELNGSQLYVNHGLGSTIPLRIQCPPEIVVYTLL
jgi:predicted MPP superfamily phosphohydrolase